MIVYSSLLAQTEMQSDNNPLIVPASDLYATMNLLCLDRQLNLNLLKLTKVSFRHDIVVLKSICGGHEQWSSLHTSK